MTTGLLFALTGAALFALGVAGVVLIDNLLRPILVGKDTKLPDFVVLIATVAGLELFGLSGFIVGPIIAALFIALWDIVTEMRRQRPACANSVLFQYRASVPAVSTPRPGR